jgi:hypothetical protein
MKLISRGYQPLPGQTSRMEPVATIELDRSTLERIGAATYEGGGYGSIYYKHTDDPVQCLERLLDKDRAAAAHIIVNLGPAVILKDALKRVAEYFDACKRFQHGPKREPKPSAKKETP